MNCSSVLRSSKLIRCLHQLEINPLFVASYTVFLLQLAAYSCGLCLYHDTAKLSVFQTVAAKDTWLMNLLLLSLSCFTDHVIVKKKIFHFFSVNTVKTSIIERLRARTS